MPIYEYQCQKCDHCFEKLVLKGNESIECPQCQTRSVKKMMSICGFSVGGKFKSSSDSSCSGCTATSCTPCKPG
ncbi:MAG: zinc ribbon domain-containing protein [Thermodesulfobacteriota bacterium]